MSVAASTSLVTPMGQGLELQRLLRLARGGKLPHAVLVEGAPGAGKTTALGWLTAALLCPSDLDADGPCGMCRTCRRIARRQHPDVHLLTLPEEKHDIPIGLVRESIDALMLRPVEGGARVLQIDPADRLNVEGHNALLKTLEEPGQATWLLLATSHPEGMPPTVLSRVQRVRLRPLDDAMLLLELRRRAPDQGRLHERAVQLAHGSLGFALDLCTPQAAAHHDLATGLLDAGRAMKPIEAARKALEGADSGKDAAAAARGFLAVFRAVVQQQMRDAIAAGGGGAAEPWASLLECALDAGRDLDVHIPADQALCGMLLRARAVWG
ncbi:MAG: hypothetical protein RIT25_2812 [Planctomycetota bacterium]